MGGTPMGGLGADSSARANAGKKTKQKAAAAKGSFTKVRYRSELRPQRERNATFQIADCRFQIYRWRRDPPDRFNRKSTSKFDNSGGTAA
jgi:hypothetical protein